MLNAFNGTLQWSNFYSELLFFADYPNLTFCVLDQWASITFSSEK